MNDNDKRDPFTQLPAIDSAALLSGIVSTATDAIISIDQDQRITLFNHGAQTIFGYSSHEVVGQPLTMLLPKSYQASHRAHVEQFGASGDNARRMGERTGRRLNTLRAAGNR